jgi:hypothetical protein
MTRNEIAALEIIFTTEIADEAMPILFVKRTSKVYIVTSVELHTNGTRKRPILRRLKGSRHIWGE